MKDVDPTLALSALRRFFTRISVLDEDVPQAVRQDCEQAVGIFEELDEWLEGGGDYPHAWAGPRQDAPIDIADGDHPVVVFEESRIPLEAVAAFIDTPGPIAVPREHGEARRMLSQLIAGESMCEGRTRAGGSVWTVPVGDNGSYVLVADMGGIVRKLRYEANR